MTAKAGGRAAQSPTGTPRPARRAGEEAAGPRPDAGPWLEEARARAWAAFRAEPDPARTVEAWRRADFRSWRLDLLTDANLPVLLGPERGAPEPARQDDTAGGFHQAGNRLPAAIELSPEAAAKGVLLMSLEEAAAAKPDLVKPFLGELEAPSEYRKLEAASLARFRGGAFLLVPKGVRVDKPIELVFSHYQASPFAFPRVLAVVEDGAEVTVVESHLFEERHASNDARKLVSIAFSRLAAGRDSRVRWFYDQELSPETVHFSRHRADLAAGAFLEHGSVLVGSAVHKSEVEARLDGAGARSELRAVLFGSKGQLFDPRTVQWHRAPSTSSDLLFRAALKDRARSIYTGLIRIEPDAKGSDAFQQNDNLLLSNDARADSTPVLEILTDEVRCKHGATVGPVDPEALFYLSTRGFEPEEAVRTLLLAFLEPLLGKLPLERLRRRVPEKVEKRLRA